MSDDPKLSQRYRELPREEPPRALDDAILAASRRAAESRPAPLVAPTGRRRWYFPVAAAAVIVLAVAVVAHVDREKPDEEILASSAPAPQTQPSAVEEPRVEAPKAAEAPARAPAPQRRDQAPRQAAKPAGPQFTPDPRAESAPAAAAPAPAAPASTADQRKEVDELRSRQADNEAAGARAQRAPAPPVSTTLPALARVAPSPEQWLQGIADLRRQGRHEEADRELVEFRKRYPGYRLSDEMKAKVERP